MKAFSLGISETLHFVLKQSSLTLRLLNVYMQAQGETKKTYGIKTNIKLRDNNSEMCKI